MFQVIKGDLLYANAAAICHQVNCRSAMGSGVAKAIYTKWPEVKTEYHKFCERFPNPKDLLGKIQVIPVNGGLQVVINIFGQLNYGRSKGTIYTNYDALVIAFTEINRIYKHKSIAFPYRFGCGLAGGDWCTVESLMIDCLGECDVQVYMRV